MKSLAFVTMLLLPITGALSQSNIYPLGIGDKWVYWEYGQYGGVWDTITATVDNDTIIGEKLYKIRTERSSHYLYQVATFERVDSSGDVYIWDASAGKDSLRYRLSDTSGSWWPSNGILTRFDSCVVKDIFGQPRKVLYIGGYDAADTSLRGQVLLVDGIGYYTQILFGLVDGAPPSVLHEARINGVFYGLSGGGDAVRNACFPLHIGDTWQWSQIVDPNPSHPIVEVWQTTVVGDTLMPNGHHYAIERDVGAWSYVRQQGDSVFIWSPYGEWLYFDFSRAPGDTVVTNRGVPGDTLLVITLSRDTLMTFGARRCVWYFWTDIPGMVDDERGYRVVDSIGVTDIDLSFGGPYHFQGARVNGVVYGILTGVEAPKDEGADIFTLEQNYPGIDSIPQPLSAMRCPTAPMSG